MKVITNSFPVPDKVNYIEMHAAEEGDLERLDKLAKELAILLGQCIVQDLKTSDFLTKALKMLEQEDLTLLEFHILSFEIGSLIGRLFAMQEGQ